jgi:hypothetical protein
MTDPTPRHAPETRIIIASHISRDRILKVSDALSTDEQHSKVRLDLVELSETGKQLQAVHHWLRIGDAKLIFWDIVNWLFTEWNDHKGSAQGIEPPAARVLSLRKDVKYRQPFVLKMHNGTGERLPDGGVKMVETTESLTLLMPEHDARRLSMTVLDYIRDWETVNFRRRQEAQTVITPEGFR